MKAIVYITAACVIAAFAPMAVIGFAIACLPLAFDRS